MFHINFYFNHSKLFFALETFDTFLYEKDKLSSDYPPTDTTFHGYYYFKKNFLIYYVSTGHNRFEDGFLDPDKILIEEVTKYLNLLKNKRKINNAENTIYNFINKTNTICKTYRFHNRHIK